MMKNVKNLLLILLGLFSFAGTISATDNEQLCEGLVQEGLSLDVREELEFLGEGQYQVLLLSCEGRLYVSLPTEGTASDTMPSYQMIDMMPGLGHHEGVLWRKFCTDFPERDDFTSAVWFDDRFLSSEEYCDQQDTSSISIESVEARYESSTESEDGLYIGGDIGAMFTGVEGLKDNINGPCGRIFSTPRWSDRNSDLGPLAGGFAGYRRGNIRYEGEYFFHKIVDCEIYSVFEFSKTSHVFRIKSSNGERNKINGITEETRVANGKIDDITSHNGAFNIYYDFDSIDDVKPYVGGGVVISQVSRDVWTRNHDPDQIKTFDELLLTPTTLNYSNFQETLLGYQVLAGLDFWVHDEFSLGFKVRWMDMRVFEDSDSSLGQLQNHESSHQETTNGIRGLGITFNTKYQWRRQR